VVLEKSVLFSLTLTLNQESLTQGVETDVWSIQSVEILGTSNGRL
jgi:hypothetical protein